MDKSLLFFILFNAYCFAVNMYLIWNWYTVDRAYYYIHHKRPRLALLRDIFLFRLKKIDR